MRPDQQAKRRVERSFGTAQDRWVKELRLAWARTCERANAVRDGLRPGHDRRSAVAPRVTADCHRALGRAFDLASILSLGPERVASNDDVARFANRHSQSRPPTWPGVRGGRVVVEKRRDGTPAIRFGDRTPRYDELPRGTGLGGSAPRPPEFGAGGTSASRVETSLPTDGRGIPRPVRSVQRRITRGESRSKR